MKFRFFVGAWFIRARAREGINGSAEFAEAPPLRLTVNIAGG
jgi:hypothetical protein